MPDLIHALQNGSTNLWFFIPTAILLGGLHGLEPGHSKTMMAAFIVAIHGTIWQAVLLGLSAAISHTAIIWILVGGVLHFGSRWDAESVEPYLQLGSAICILALAVWMFLRTRRDVAAAQGHEHHHHSHDHHHAHGEEHDHDHDDESAEYQDAHERAHAQDIAKRFAGQNVTTPQIILFGLTGGLLPCPAAFSVLLICLQLKRAALGFTMVGAFSVGLAITMVTAGVVAAIGVQQAHKRFSGFGALVRKAPYVSCVVMVALALLMAWHGWRGLAG